MKRPNIQQLQKQCDEFNAKVQVGSLVEITLDDGSTKVAKLRGEAVVLGGHTPVCWVEGIAGAYLLDRVQGADDAFADAAFDREEKYHG